MTITTIQALAEHFRQVANEKEKEVTLPLDGGEPDWENPAHIAFAQATAMKQVESLLSHDFSGGFRSQVHAQRKLTKLLADQLLEVYAGLEESTIRVKSNSAKIRVYTAALWMTGTIFMGHGVTEDQFVNALL